MAKLTNCAFCGKEITSGIFSGEAEEVEVADCVNLKVCPSCYKQIKKVAKEEKERFTTKLANLKWENKCRPSNAEIAAYYAKYLEGRAAVAARVKSDSEIGMGWFYRYSEDGLFGWTERRMGFMGEDISLKDKAKAITKNVQPDAFGFDKNDISCIEFRLASGDNLGLFKKAYSVEICLNHEKTMSYKPCYAKTAIIVTGLAGYKKKAAQQVIEQLEAFKRHIGSDLPIRQVKKFK